MKLDKSVFEQADLWTAKGYDLPKFDREQMIAKTKAAPFWVHFGAGNIFRAFQANAVQKLLNAGVLDRGLVAVEGYDDEIIEKTYRPHDNIHILATLKAAGTVEKTVVASIAESVAMGADAAGFERAKAIFEADSLQMATFTITEKGYSLVNGRGEQLPAVKADLENGPAAPQSYIGKIAALLYARYRAGAKPVAMVSMDNCSHNGDKLYAAVKAFAEAWNDAGFKAYVEDSGKVSFPWTMIDKITPRPDADVQAMIEADGVEDMQPAVTSKNSYTAPFVNSEECEYLVIEDKFPNGRPELEKAGFMFTERETVDKVEKMKVCTCLNPLHTALAVLGCLLGYNKICDEMNDADLKALVEKIGYVEGLPVVVNPGVLNPKDFIDAVVYQRLPNPFMPDTPQRIATDTSQKLSIRYGETVKAYLKSGTLNVADLKGIPFVFAAWLRYLTGVNDEGEAFAISSDPRLDEMKEKLAGLTPGKTEGIEAVVSPVLRDATVWGVDLYEAGLAAQVIAALEKLMAGPGAVRRTLKEIVA